MRCARPSAQAPSPAGRARDSAGRRVARVLTFAASGLLALTLTGCQPPVATPAEAAAAALRAQGASDAQVQMQEDSFRAVLTQRDGRQSLVSVGIGTVGPADFGAPWYPRAEADPQRSSKLSGTDGQVASTVLRTREPIEQVLTFYRDLSLIHI